MVKIFSQSSLIPLSKISNAPTKSIKILWTLFSIVMLIGLVTCISLVVIQYCHHQTIFQLDYSGKRVEYDMIPAVTLCHSSKSMLSMFQNLLMKKLQISKVKEIFKKSQSDGVLPWQHSSIRDVIKNITTNYFIIVNSLKPGVLTWTSDGAISPFYRLLGNLSVNFKTIPSSKEYHIVAYEQVPHTRSFLCTTFELKNSKEHQPWVRLEILINNTDTIIPSKAGELSLITHEAGSLPFSAYDRHITETLSSGDLVHIFLSKSVTIRLNTDRNPCNEYTTTINLFGRNYSYGHDACGWKMCCTKCYKTCNCICPIDILRQNSKPCNRTCQQNNCASKGSYSKCPSACTIIKYNKHNKNKEKIKPSTYQLILIKSDNNHIAIEEQIYTLTKLFSEVGGLCSLFIGFSCIFIFELVEVVILWRSGLLTECINDQGHSHNHAVERSRGFQMLSSDKDIPLISSITLDIEENVEKEMVSTEEECKQKKSVPQFFIIKIKNSVEKARFINAVKDGTARLKLE